MQWDGNEADGKGTLGSENRLCLPAGSTTLVMAKSPSEADALNRALTAYRARKLSNAELLCLQAIADQPYRFDALLLLAVVQSSQGKNELALATYDQALEIQPNHVGALSGRAGTLRALNRLEEALLNYDRALAIQPEFAEALNGHGVTLYEMGRYAESLAKYDCAITLRPGYVAAFCNRGNVLNKLHQPDEALESYNQALMSQPENLPALYNRAQTLNALQRYPEALADFDKVLAIRPAFADALCLRGNILRELKRYEEALTSYERALALRPGVVEVLISRGVVLHEMGRYSEALTSYDSALALQSHHAGAWYCRGMTLKVTDQLEKALGSFENALAVKPDHGPALSGAADCAMKLCDWRRWPTYILSFNTLILEKRSIVQPFYLLGCIGDPALQLKCAKNYNEHDFGARPLRLWAGQRWRNEKIRVAYVSANYRRHPMANLMVGLFERHDRSRFEIVGISFGVDDQSAIRQRVISAFDEFHDVRKMSDLAVAKLLHDRRIDIAIDLQGFTQDARTKIFAYRPAPIQVNYLGYPGTSGTDFMDYIIADKIVIPIEHEAFYSEKIARLPESYWVHSDIRIADYIPTRREMGLPENGFVFCCFNNSWKITPDVFDVWMRLMRQVDGSTLWLLSAGEAAERNLRQEAQRRGVDPVRLVFAGLCPHDEHLARYRLADLFLDTLPYNAHTTASDALWVGLPLLTCSGNSFAGRVASSLLRAVGLHEMITSTLNEYESVALNLATHPERLVQVKAKLARNRDVYPLFNTAEFTKHIEAAYVTMWERWQRGQSPLGFDVDGRH